MECTNCEYLIEKKVMGNVNGKRKSYMKYSCNGSPYSSSMGGDRLISLDKQPETPDWCPDTIMDEEFPGTPEEEYDYHYQNEPSGN